MRQGAMDQRWQHPRATVTTIEAAPAARWAGARARRLQDAAPGSAAAELTAPEAPRPRRPGGGQLRQARGQDERQLTARYEQPIMLSRHYAACPACRTGLAPPG
jgi:hypothetical protein